MQDFITEGYALTRVHDTARRAAAARVPDDWIALSDVHLLSPTARTRFPLREWITTHLGWETLGVAINGRPGPAGRLHTGHSAFQL